jgi:Transcriptional regulator
MIGLPVAAVGLLPGHRCGVRKISHLFSHPFPASKPLYTVKITIGYTVNCVASYGDETMTIADRKAREKMYRRNDIINAAEKLFFAKGYDNVSMEDIAKEVELNRATLYLYFKNKETLYLAIVRRAALKLRDLTEGRLNKNEADIYEKVDALGYSLLYFAQFHADYFRAYRDFQMGRFDRLDIDPESEDLKELAELQKDYVALWFKVINDGKSFGIIKRDIDPRLAAVLMMTAFEGIAGMRPALKEEIESWGIDAGSFEWGDFRFFLYDLIGIKKFKQTW